MLKEVVTGKQLQDVKAVRVATAACASCLTVPGGPGASCWGDAMLVWRTGVGGPMEAGG